MTESMKRADYKDMSTCHICQTGEAKHRCHTCGKLICDDCADDTGLKCNPCAEDGAYRKDQEEKYIASERAKCAVALEQKRASACTALGVISTLLIVIGIFVILDYLMLDPSVAVPGAESLGIESGRVNNIGLLAEKQNGIICGFGTLFLGVALAIWDHVQRQAKSP